MATFAISNSRDTRCVTSIQQRCIEISREKYRNYQIHNTLRNSMSRERELDALDRIFFDFIDTGSIFGASYSMTCKRLAIGNSRRVWLKDSTIPAKQDQNW